MEPTSGTALGSHRSVVFVALVTAVLLAAGCSASSGDQASSSGADAGSGAQAPRAGDGQLGSAVDAAAGPAAEAAAAEREVVTTGTATVVAADPPDAAARIATLTEEAGGRVELREERRATDGAPASAHLTLRLPADTVNRTLDALRGLGEVADVSLTKEDVTATGRDLDARIAALETSTARLMELMAKAADTADLLRVEKELSTRQADLDALKAQRADLSDRVAMSTLDVHVVADQGAVAALAPPATGFRGGLEAGWHALTATLRVAAVTFGALLPWLLLAGLVLVVWRGAVFLVRRRRLTTG